MSRPTLKCSKRKITTFRCTVYRKATICLLQQDGLSERKLSDSINTADEPFLHLWVSKPIYFISICFIANKKLFAPTQEDDNSKGSNHWEEYRLYIIVPFLPCIRVIAINCYCPQNQIFVPVFQKEEQIHQFLLCNERQSLAIWLDHLNLFNSQKC